MWLFKIAISLDAKAIFASFKFLFEKFTISVLIFSILLFKFIYGVNCNSSANIFNSLSIFLSYTLIKESYLVSIKVSITLVSLFLVSTSLNKFIFEIIPL